VSTAVLDPCAGALTTERGWALPADLAAERGDSALASAVTLDAWMTALTRDLERGGPVACLACGDPSGVRAAADGGFTTSCERCGSILS
jgi:hypothetical protein